MTFGKALDLANLPPSEGEIPKKIFLACGFTPLHLTTFLKAHGRQRFPAAGVEIRTGVFDDLAGSLERSPAKPGEDCVVFIEWADLDPRVGLRSAAGWARPSLFSEIETEVAHRLDRLSTALRQPSCTAVIGPTLPLPPCGITGCAQETAFELRLRLLIDRFLAELAARPNIRIVSQQELAIASPVRERLDAGMALGAGFPYSLAHTHTLALLTIETLYPAESKKGIITDLDDTLWLGILGEAGVENVAWSLEHRAQAHGLYQQFLASMAERGVLIAVATKNDPALVQSALARPDLLIPAAALFPIEASWNAKSASVARILQAWNIGAQDVVFVDDSPMELEEVASAFPGITGLRFPAKEPQALWQMFRELRSLFGRQQIQDEDRIRVASLRSSSGGPPPSGDDFLRQLKGRVTIDIAKNPADTRAFELLNKTNQFNLNGRRWTQGEWQQALQDPAGFLVTVSYEDKFGPLGKISVAVGSLEGHTLNLAAWVLSCRAFSRRIEHQTLNHLISQMSAHRIVLDYQPTERNGPMRIFLEEVLGAPPASSPVEFTAEGFAACCPPLPHVVSTEPALVRS